MPISYACAKQGPGFQPPLAAPTVCQSQRECTDTIACPVLAQLQTFIPEEFHPKTVPRMRPTSVSLPTPWPLRKPESFCLHLCTVFCSSDQIKLPETQSHVVFLQVPPETTVTLLKTPSHLVLQVPIPCPLLFSSPAKNHPQQPFNLQSSSLVALFLSMTTTLSFYSLRITSWPLSTLVPSSPCPIPHK